MGLSTQKTDSGFLSHAPGFWKADEPTDWDSHLWQLKNRVNSLPELEKHLELSQEERSGVLLSGSKLDMSITPHYFNLINPTDPDCPIRRQVIPRVEETISFNEELADHSAWTGSSIP